MKSIVMAAAALATLIAVAPVQGATAGELPQYFNDQGEQVPAFPRSRFASNAPAQASAQPQGLGASGHLPATFNDQGQQVPAFPVASGASVSITGADKALRGCFSDMSRAGSC